MPLQQKVTYLPVDRAIALLRGTPLPENQTGTALLADVSGFSSLAEALRRHHGDQKGAELLILHLNAAFEALIGSIHLYGGSAVSFSGDAITCWFDAEHCGGERAAACAALTAAVTMRTRLAELATIPMPDGSKVQLYTKTVLASGIVQRWVLGIATIQLLDTLSGAPVDRLSEAEKSSAAGQIVADQPTLELLDAAAHSTHTWDTFAVLELAAPCAKPNPWPLVTDADFAPDVLAQWLLPSVAQQIDANISSLTELRMTVALFLRFTPTSAAAPTRASTNHFIRWAQRTITTYGGNLLQVTFGDKGSYLYAAFGAPVSYSDNPFRAVEAALVLRRPPEDMGYAVQLGVSTGLMRTGSYGAVQRHTYGVQGDEVNVAARLMMHAASGQALISAFVMEQLTDFFTFGALQAITVKGQPTPVEAAVLIEKVESSVDTITMQAVTPPREGHGVRAGIRRQLLEAIIASVYSRETRLIHLWSEAGMGKTYLTAAVRKALESELPVLWMSAPCDEILKFPLGPFRFLIQHFFRQRDITLGEGTGSLDAFYDDLRQQIQNAPRLPEELRTKLLAEVGRNRQMLRFFITQSSEKASVQFQQTINFDALSREILSLLRAISVRQPLVIHLQDAQVLDPDSLALTGKLLRSDTECSITVILSNSSSEQQRETAALPPELARFPHETLHLAPMTEAEIKEIVEQWLDGQVAQALIADIYSQSHGNPLFVRLLVDHLRSRGQIAVQRGRWDFTDAYDRNDLPGEIQTHLVARIDRLGPKLKSVIQAAAVLGQNFDAKVLAALLEDDDMPQHLSAGAEAGVWTQVADARYEFTQSLMRSVAYTMLGQERQVALHRAAAHAGLKVYHDDPGQLVEFMGHMRIAEQRKAGLV